MFHQAFHLKGNQLQKPCHIINIETKDDATHSIIGANHAANLAEIFTHTQDLDMKVFDIIETYQLTAEAPQIFHSIMFS